MLPFHMGFWTLMISAGSGIINGLFNHNCIGYTPEYSRICHNWFGAEEPAKHRM
jgi:hypothetical protein